MLLLLGAVPLAAGDLWPPALGLAAFYFVVLFGAVAVELWLGPGAGALAVERLCEPFLYIGADNTVGVSVSSWAGRPLRLAIRDEYPPEFSASDVYLATGLTPGARVEVHYTVRPPSRGLFSFGDVVLRVEGAPGLVTRQHRYPAQAAVKVYPNLREISKYELLSRRGLLAEAGLKTARQFGAGTEFEYLREYLPDDDYRRIDWKASARRNAPITVEHETERSQNVLVLLDTGRLMGARVDGLTKLDHAVNCLALLAYVAVRHGDRVGLLAFADRVESYLAPARGRRQLFRLVDAIHAVQPQPVEANLGQALAYLGNRNPKRSLLVLFSDLADPEPAREAAAHLRLAARRHLLAYVSVRDRELADLAAAEVHDTRGAYGAAVAQRLLGERLEIIETLSRQGIIALDLPTEQLTAGVINKYLEIKARTRL